MSVYYQVVRASHRESVCLLTLSLTEMMFPVNKRLRSRARLRLHALTHSVIEELDRVRVFCRSLLSVPKTLASFARWVNFFLQQAGTADESLSSTGRRRSRGNQACVMPAEYILVRSSVVRSFNGR